MKRTHSSSTGRPCPTPGKALYRSADEANAAALIAGRASRAVPLKVYRCRCGFWHLASDWEADRQ